jgi:hypothetical protein
MTTNAPARNRDDEARKAKERARVRYGTMSTDPSSRGN